MHCIISQPSGSRTQCVALSLAKSECNEECGGSAILRSCNAVAWPEVSLPRPLSFKFPYRDQGYIQHQVVSRPPLSHSACILLSTINAEIPATRLLLVVRLEARLSAQVRNNRKPVAYCLTIGTTITTIRTAIPTPMMIRIRISFHLLDQLFAPCDLKDREAGIPHLLTNTISTPSEPLGGDSEII
jgi:hypothetical protein